MSRNPYFPKIHCRATADGCEAVAAMKLDTILSGQLLRSAAAGTFNDAADNAVGTNCQLAHEALLKSIALWPQEVRLGLSIVVLPDIEVRSQTVFLVTLLVAETGAEPERVRENVLARYMALMPVLESHITWCSFSPVVDEKDFLRRYRPFDATHALAIGRRQENILLSEDFGSQTVGFSRPASAGIRWESAISHTYPWVPSRDSWLRMLTTLSCQLDPVQLLVRISPQHMHGMSAGLAARIRTCEELMAAERTKNITFRSRLQMLLNTYCSQAADLSANGFKAGAFLIAPHPIDEVLGSVAGQAFTDDPGCGSDDVRMYQGGFSCRAADVERVREWDFFDGDEPYSVSEAACAFRLPFPPMEDLPGLPIRHSRTGLANVQQGVKRNTRKALSLFQNNHGRVSQPIRIQSDQRMRHCFILGQTGTGKSQLMKSWIKQDIERGDGVALIDPHGELVEEILALIPAHRRNDVVLLDLLQERPVGFNLLEYRTIKERDLIIDELYLAIDKMWDLQKVGGPIFENHYRNMLQLLLGTPTCKRTGFIPTLLEFTPCYQNDDFRKWLMATTDDEQVRDFIQEMEQGTGDANLHSLSVYITSKFTRFIADSTVKRIIGQEKTRFSFEDIMNNRKIFLVNLAKGRLGSAVAGLLTNQFVSRFKLAAMQRAEIRPEERRDFYLYVDEAHNLPADNFIELLAESRKYRMGLVLATQYTAQLKQSAPGSTNLLSSILGNVGTTVIFRVGAEDAELLDGVVAPLFSKRDLIGLPNFEGYARMSTNTTAPQPFSFKTVLPSRGFGPERAQAVRDLSSLSYAKDADMVDLEIKKRRQFVESGGKQNPFEKYGPK